MVVCGARRLDLARTSTGASRRAPRPDRSDDSAPFFVYVFLPGFVGLTEKSPVFWTGLAGADFAGGAALSILIFCAPAEPGARARAGSSAWRPPWWRASTCRRRPQPRARPPL